MATGKIINVPVKLHKGQHTSARVPICNRDRQAVLRASSAVIKFPNQIVPAQDPSGCWLLPWWVLWAAPAGERLPGCHVRCLAAAVWRSGDCCVKWGLTANPPSAVLFPTEQCGQHYSLSHTPQLCLTQWFQNNNPLIWQTGLQEGGQDVVWQSVRQACPYFLWSHSWEHRLGRPRVRCSPQSSPALPAAWS